MSCCSSCGGAAGTCGCERGFAVNVAGEASPFPEPRPTVQSPLCGSLAQSLIKVVDQARNLNTRFGFRPYNVRLVRTRWSGGRRNVGFEEVVETTPIVPTPLLSDLTAVRQVNSPIGLDEIGDVLITEISGAYSENQLVGYGPRGTLISADENFYWEVEFPSPCEGVAGERRRFTVNAAPFYVADAFQWHVNLTRQRVDRTRAGVPVGP